MSTRRLAALLLTLAPHLGHAACGLASTGVAFGVYDVFSNSHTDSTGTITVSCDLATPYTLSLSPGSGGYGQRTLLAGPHSLAYNLYSDPARSQVWGDGSGGSTTVAGTADGTVNHWVHGRIPARQNARVGIYADTVVITLEY
ncbi:MAG: spore coat U domain-containing protein [Porticoccaceae bacterium]|jgi:spore coat protein U-like protein|nr:spore coat U domain-containing protein [Porticoccaceae bacterium]MEA3299333.1 spore coat U domain-containing protein [Pseudomonadota bacterium]